MSTLSMVLSIKPTMDINKTFHFEILMFQMNCSDGNTVSKKKNIHQKLQCQKLFPKKNKSNFFCHYFAKMPKFRYGTFFYPNLCSAIYLVNSKYASQFFS